MRSACDSYTARFSEWAALSGLLVLPMARIRDDRAAVDRVLAAAGSISAILGLARGYSVIGAWILS